MQTLIVVHETGTSLNLLITRLIQAPKCWSDIENNQLSVDKDSKLFFSYKQQVLTHITFKPPIDCPLQKSIWTVIFAILIKINR